MKLILTRIASISAGFVIVYLAIGCAGEPPKISINAKPEDVAFIQLSATCTDIQCYDDGYMKAAFFNASEDEFKSVFSSFSFKEITSRTHYLSTITPLPRAHPGEVFASSFADSGLIHQTVYSNGGGYTIVYDRDTRRASFHYMPR